MSTRTGVDELTQFRTTWADSPISKDKKQERLRVLPLLRRQEVDHHEAGRGDQAGQAPPSQPSH